MNKNISKVFHCTVNIFFFQAEDGIRDFCLSRGLGDVYKRQKYIIMEHPNLTPTPTPKPKPKNTKIQYQNIVYVNEFSQKKKKKEKTNTEEKYFSI